MNDNNKKDRQLIYISILIPLFILLSNLYLGLLVNKEVAFLGRKPIVFLILFLNSFWIIRFIWEKLRTINNKKFYEMYRYIWLYVPALWSIGVGLYFATAAIFFGFVSVISSDKDKIELASGFVSSHVFYECGWIILIAFLSMSKTVMDKIGNLKRPGHYSVIIVALLWVVMYLNPEKAMLPKTYNELKPNLIVLIVEILYIWVFLMILFSLFNKKKSTNLIGIISCSIIIMLIFFTNIGLNYVNRFTYNFLFFGPTILFAMLSLEIILWQALRKLGKR
ncbi:MAG: hypothetical protein HZC48_01330 [Nitrospirae bacterium]|nr:hypothetical protein [Nitrospirota bacterium]